MNVAPSARRLAPPRRPMTPRHMALSPAIARGAFYANVEQAQSLVQHNEAALGFDAT